MPNRFAIHLTRNVLDALAHDEAGHTAGEFDYFDATLDRRARFRKCLAMLARDTARDLFGMRHQQLTELEQYMRAIDGRLVRPRGESVGRRLDDLVHFLRRAERHFRDHL